MILKDNIDSKTYLNTYKALGQIKNIFITLIKPQTLVFVNVFPWLKHINKLPSTDECEYGRFLKMIRYLKIKRKLSVWFGDYYELGKPKNVVRSIQYIRKITEPDKSAVKDYKKIKSRIYFVIFSWLNHSVVYFGWNLAVRIT